MTDKTAYEQMIERRAMGTCHDIWDDLPEAYKVLRRDWARQSFEADEAEGLALVPEKATGEMVEAGRRAVVPARLGGAILWKTKIDAANEAGRIRRE